MIPRAAGREAATPAYKKIQEGIRARIRSGELKPGDLIASERELARTWGVSLMTARHAVKEMEREGLVVRRPATGTFVAPPRVEFNKLVSFTDQIASRGLLPHSRLLAATMVENDDVAARLGVPHGGEVVKLERLRFAADEPLSLETCYLSQAAFPDILTRQLDRRSLFGVLENDYNVKLAYADEEVDAASADGRTAELLKIPRGAALIRLRQLLYSTAGQTIAYSLGLYRSDRHTLKVRRYR
jgi:GntR family transcriptional regulator